MKRKLVFLLTLITLLLSSCDLAGGLASLTPTRPAVSTVATDKPSPTAPSVTSSVASSILPTADLITTTWLTTTAPVTTSAVTTTEPAITTASVTTAPTTTETVTTEEVPASPSDGESPTLVSMTDTVSRGNQATVTIKGEPGKIYTITVYYPSSVSTAKGLEPKAADSNGKVSWSWRIGSRTSEGTHRIVITGGEEPLTLYLTVTS